jgi:uncharacterized membrane protein
VLLFADESIDVTVYLENTGNVKLQHINVALEDATADGAQDIELAASGNDGFKQVTFKYKLKLADLEREEKTFEPKVSGAV